tara:strand:+ start:427 stop:2310 length:1884 start_codon:yes stop_codon:yes gene_type:complete
LKKLKLINLIFLPIIGLDLRLRRFLLILIDGSIIFSSVLASFSLSAVDLTENFYWISNNSIFLGLFIFFITKQYNGLSRYNQSQDVFIFLFRNILFLLSLSLYGKLRGQSFPSIRVFILILILNSVLISFSRIIISTVINYVKSQNRKRKNVIIYGAGEAGAQLSASLKINRNYNVIYFVDDDINLIGRTINGIKIRNPKDIIKINKKFDQILLAIPSLSTSKRIDIINKIQNYGNQVLQIPSIEEIKSGKAKIDNLSPISIESLLSRQSVKPIKELLLRGIKDKAVCIIGAGGSIGKELSRQIILLNPKKLILIDLSESSLYEIDNEILNLNSFSPNFKSILGNAIDDKFIKEIFLKYQINIVFHSAAYKHVPIVEDNPIEGIYNNVFSTFSICSVAKEINLEKVIFISTDKAVRPTNVMGASKRLAELIVQSFANQNTSNPKLTTFSMVRFGNVLGSSGSVVPKFREQIEKGGPITLTHPEVVRYFMTIPEAVQLVIQASEMAQGGEVFLLDMGKPIKIKDLAEQMIKLSGFSVKNEFNPNGDIEIINIGLRPGEKLYEELTISSKSEKTIHELILKTYESSIDSDKLLSDLKSLKKCLKERKLNLVFRTLSNLVPEWKNPREKY